MSQAKLNPTTVQTSPPAGAATAHVRLPLLDVTRRVPVASEATLQIGDLAKAAGKTVRAIHHYEELGLLKPDARSKGRFRLYDEGAVARVRWIGKLSDLGMSLPEIQKVLEVWETANVPAEGMAGVRSVYRARLEATRTQIEHLRGLEKELVASIAYLDTCDSCSPREISELAAVGGSSAIDAKPGVVCRACELREREAQPDLVAGIVS